VTPISGIPKFDAVVVYDGEFKHEHGGFSVSVRTALVNTKTGGTMAFSHGTSAVMSDETKELFQKFLASYEQDVLRVLFDGPTSASSSESGIVAAWASKEPEPGLKSPRKGAFWSRKEPHG